jgi:Tfp pilus assembly protein PilP
VTIRESIGRCCLASMAAAAVMGLVSPASGRAQTAAPQKPPVAAAAAAPAAPENYTYKSEGRRDPFVGLVRQGTASRTVQKRPEGLKGVSFSEVLLSGVMRGEDRSCAVLVAPDGRHYIVHAGDRLFDGVVKSITRDSITVLQDVNDPLSLVKQREVRKTLRAVEEVK